MKAFEESGYELVPVLRTMFNSQFFKDARFLQDQEPGRSDNWYSPAGGATGNIPFPGSGCWGSNPDYMGQAVLDPPSVEGWYTGKEWINSGSLLARVNFVADHLADTSLPGVKSIIADMKAAGVSNSRSVVGGGPGTHGLPGTCRRDQRAVVGVHEGRRRPGLERRSRRRDPNRRDDGDDRRTTEYQFG